jgi:hypothetical protein
MVLTPPPGGTYWNCRVIELDGADLAPVGLIVEEHVTAFTECDRELCRLTVDLADALPTSGQLRCTCSRKRHESADKKQNGNRTVRMHFGSPRSTAVHRSMRFPGIVVN